MKPEQINIAVMRELGWRDEPSKVRPGKLYWFSADTVFSREDPINFHSSLDACAEMRKSLSDKLDEKMSSEQTRFAEQVVLVGRRNGSMKNSFWILIDAPASWQSEAFLHVKGKWKE